VLLRPKWSLIPRCRHIHFIRYDSVFENLHRNSVYSIYFVKWDILSSRMEVSDYWSSLYPAVRLLLLSKDIRYAKNALSRFNVTSVVRAAIGSVNLLAK